MEEGWGYKVPPEIAENKSFIKTPVWKCVGAVVIYIIADLH